jgi:sec-independent protein translocase protein TatA
MSNIGLPEIAIVLVIVLVIFGPKRLPQLGRSLGSGMREFKDAVTGKHKDDEQDELEAATAPPVPAEPVTNATARTDDETPSTTAKTADAS